MWLLFGVVPNTKRQRVVEVVASAAARSRFALGSQVCGSWLALFLTRVVEACYQQPARSRFALGK